MPAPRSWRPAAGPSSGPPSWRVGSRLRRGRAHPGSFTRTARSRAGSAAAAPSPSSSARPFGRSRTVNPGCSGCPRTGPAEVARVGLGWASGWRVTLFDPIADPDAFPAAEAVLGDRELRSLEVATPPYVVVATQGLWDV